jgi:NAD(P)-dependent dehydrogenase (short-subunit alcohol dehydrogenase family)
MTDLLDLTGQTALVTGASSGLGTHFEMTLAKAGARVAIGARRTDRLEALAGDIEAAGGRALPVALDVTDADSVAEAVRIAEEELGPITILVNNAGVPSMGRALDMDEEEWDRVVGTNLKGAWLTAREVGRHMMKHGQGGRIINISSILGLTAGRRALSYSASKAGVIAMTQNMALELGDTGIRVNAIAPGYVVTDLNRDFLLGKGGDRIKSRVPLGRFGEPEDLDGILLLLAGPGASYITGSVVVVDGGLTLSTL